VNLACVTDNLSFSTWSLYRLHTIYLKISTYLDGPYDAKSDGDQHKPEEEMRIGLAMSDVRFQTFQDDIRSDHLPRGQGFTN